MKESWIGGRESAPKAILLKIIRVRVLSRHDGKDSFCYIQLNMYETITLKKTKNGFKDLLSLNAGQKYCRMLQGEHSAILSTFITVSYYLPLRPLFCLFSEWPLKTGFTVCFGRVPLALGRNRSRHRNETRGHFRLSLNTTN